MDRRCVYSVCAVETRLVCRTPRRTMHEAIDVWHLRRFRLINLGRKDVVSCDHDECGGETTGNIYYVCVTVRCP